MYERKQMSYNTRGKPIWNCTNECLKQTDSLSLRVYTGLHKIITEKQLTIFTQPFSDKIGLQYNKVAGHFGTYASPNF